MASINEVAEALVERIKPALDTGWHVPWPKPTPAPVPSVCVTPDPNTYALYQITHSSFTQWAFRLELYATAKDRDAAYRVVGSLTDPRGPLITRLLDEDVRDTLWDLAGQNVAVINGKAWKLRGGRSPYLTADIGITVGAN